MSHYDQYNRWVFHISKLKNLVRFESLFSVFSVFPYFLAWFLYSHTTIIGHPCLCIYNVDVNAYCTFCIVDFFSTLVWLFSLFFFSLLDSFRDSSSFCNNTSLLCFLFVTTFFLIYKIIFLLNLAKTHEKYLHTTWFTVYKYWIRFYLRH